MISVGSGRALVIGDKPLSTAWLPLFQKNDGFLVRWDYAENESSVIEALSDLRNVKWEDTGVKIQLSGNKLILFDAACDGRNIDEKLEIKLANGSYEIQTSHYKPNNETSLILHRFKEQ